MVFIRASRPDDGDFVVEIWRAAVDATHDFLRPEDRQAIDLEVQAYLPQAPLWLAVDVNDDPVGFMGLTADEMDSLFVCPEWHGRGVGRALVTHAMTLRSTLTTTVNEQNRGARAFYRQLGFMETGRSERDDQGRPYPLVQLILRAPGPAQPATPV